MEQANETPAVDTNVDGVDTPNEASNANGDNTNTESPAAKAARLKRQLKQTLKQHGDEIGEFDLSDLIGKPDETPTNDNSNSKDNNSDELGYGELAYLKAFGIEAQSEIEMVQEAMQDTGKSLKDVLSSNFFNAALNEAREAAKVNNAIPDSKRTGEGSTKDTPEYWVKKGELPPNTPENQELRRAVVNLRHKQETSGSKFSDTPVVE